MRASNLKWVVILGLGVRVLLWALQVEPAGDDGLRYLTETINLVDYGVFSTDRNVPTGATPHPDAHDLPLWPSTMAVFYKVSHSVRFTQYASVALNVLLMGVTVMFLCKILREKPFCIGGKGQAVGCAVLLFMPDSVLYSLYHMPDMMAVCFVTVGMWAYFGLVKTSKGVYALLCPMLFGLAILSKPICIPLFGALTFALPFVLKESVGRRILYVLMAFAIVGATLSPWVYRNQKAFGTAGLTTISGTNLYGCNWGRLVGTFPAAEREKLKLEMKEFEVRLQGKDKMARSKAMGAYAKRQILSHLSQYVKYTLMRHPRMYAGTGTVALFRFLGRNAECYALDDLWGSGNHAPDEPRVPYTRTNTIIGCAVQIVSWTILLVGYLFVILGLLNAVRRLPKVVGWQNRLLMLCPFLCVVLLAIVIGPITATRYRFVMIPFFAMLAAFSSLERGAEEES